MKASSTYKLLYLLNLIITKDYTKAEIIKEFEKEGLKVTRSLITYYIKQLFKNGFNVKVKINQKREKIYFVENGLANLEIKDEEFKVISDIKKLLISQKNYDNIRKTMRLFYKISNYIADEDTKLRFIDFGYYSTLNWNLVIQLEKHCKQKNLITLDYILPSNGNKYLTLRADRLKISTWSQRLYFHGILDGTKYFLHLPVDRIYMIKKVEKSNENNEFLPDELTYVVSKKTYDKLFVDEKEKVIKVENGKITLQRSIDDEFYLIQRLLYFCPDIYYISDERIIRLLKEKLQFVKAIYENRIDR